MGKLDDMRRQREALHAARNGAATDETADAEAEDDDAAGTVAPATTGKCAVCKKTLALQHDGMVNSHQKGLGKFCPGSRKPPA